MNENVIATDGPMKSLLEGLLPIVVDFITDEWDWRSASTAPVKVTLGEKGPAVMPPGCVSDDSWTIAFEGAYTWASSFTIASKSDGPIKNYLDEHGLRIECETEYAISACRIR
ncbi:hypothetical protein [Leucobacter sp. 7(1)]|uniref:hypothetical protein n=1 Tax=Leucobacter sp. 7(1) TaxID=1255613 RepID=UPI0011227939|nr:hypothetical protein [Leucobacter sp. 7(1)]